MYKLVYILMSPPKLHAFIGGIFEKWLNHEGVVFTGALVC